MNYDAAHRLADEIRRSEEYETYHRLHDGVMSDPTQAALIEEYRRLSVTMQMAVLNGQQAPAEDTQRFSMLTTLLFSKQEVSEYLLSELRLQQALSDIIRIVTEASGLDIRLPNV